MKWLTSSIISIQFASYQFFFRLVRVYACASHIKFWRKKMGYDPTRFVKVTNEEFICAICKLVIEKPVETPCEHLFCNECIKSWLAVNQKCPIDKKPLTKNVLSEPRRYLRNLYNKLDINCDFRKDNRHMHRKPKKWFSFNLYRTRRMWNDCQIGKLGSACQQVRVQFECWNRLRQRMQHDCDSAGISGKQLPSSSGE